MDVKSNDCDCESDKTNKPLNGLDCPKGILIWERVDEEDDDVESKLLLPKKGCLSKKKAGKKDRKVQWNDKNGDKLAEVLEFQPSFVSDSDDEDSDVCMCTIM